MKTISKFIISIFYHVYFNKNKNQYLNQDIFHSIFGTDEKLSIKKYLERTRYASLTNFDIETYNLKCNLLDKVAMRIKNSKDNKNPKVDVNELLYLIDLSNKQEEPIIDTDCAREYELIMKKNNKHNNETNIKKSNNPLLLEREYIPSFEKGIERARKYDN